MKILMKENCKIVEKQFRKGRKMVKEGECEYCLENNDKKREREVVFILKILI